MKISHSQWFRFGLIFFKFYLNAHDVRNKIPRKYLPFDLLRSGVVLVLSILLVGLRIQECSTNGFIWLIDIYFLKNGSLNLISLLSFLKIVTRIYARKVKSEIKWKYREKYLIHRFKNSLGYARWLDLIWMKCPRWLKTNTAQLMIDSFFHTKKWCCINSYKQIKVNLYVTNTSVNVLVLRMLFRSYS